MGKLLCEKIGEIRTKGGSITVFAHSECVNVAFNRWTPRTGVSRVEVSFDGEDLVTVAALLIQAHAVQRKANRANLESPESLETVEQDPWEKLGSPRDAYGTNL